MVLSGARRAPKLVDVTHAVLGAIIVLIIGWATGRALGRASLKSWIRWAWMMRAADRIELLFLLGELGNCLPQSTTVISSFR